MSGSLTIFLGILNLAATGFLFFHFRRNAKWARRHITLVQQGLAQTNERLEVTTRKEIRSLHFEARLLVVLSLPKCGGSSLSASLAASFPAAIVCHVHVHSRQGMDVLARWSDTTDGVNRKTLTDHLAIATSVRAIRGHIPAENTVYFAGVREPVGYAISAFFEHFAGLGTWESCATEAIEWVISGQSSTPIGVDRWFDSELLPATGCDVFATPFPCETGYAIYTRGNVRLCVYRLESFDRIRSAIADSLDVPEEMVVLESRNQADEKPYADAYRTTVRAARFPRSFLAEVYSSRYARHFYRDDERAALIDRWAAD